MKAEIGTEVELAPTRALIFYRGTKGAHDWCAVFEHPAYVDDGRTKLGPGRLVNEAAARRVLRELGDAMASKPRVLHPRVLVDSPGLFAWWLPAGRRIQFFDVSMHTGVAGRDRLQNRKAELPHPALVFIQRGLARPSTYVYALKASERPNEDTEVYLGPFLNVNSDGCVCWGNTPLPKAPIQEAFPIVEEAFFGSTFTHLNGGTVVQLEGKSCYEFFADLCDNPPASFPVEVLQPRGTLGSLVQRLAVEAR